MIVTLFILQVIVVITLSFFLIFSISNLWSLQRLGSFHQLKRYPKLSVLVPARDEERNIRRCVDSLLNQNYPNYEILVLDDHSTDRTYELVARIKDIRLKIFKGKRLPEDWLGKHWACHQLAQKATGDLLLFVDADTYHGSSSLKTAVEAMVAKNADFVTVLPKEEARTLAEKLVMPIIGWSLVTFMPLFMAKRSKRPSLSATIGQFMLFKKEAYQKIGGYPAIRGEVLDDVIFGRKVKSFGLRWRIFDGKTQMGCRMYHNFEEISAGFSRCIFATFKNNLFYFFISIFFLLYVFLSSWFMVVLWFFGLIGEVVLGLSLLAIGLSYVTWSISNIRFNYPPWLTLFSPVIIVLVGYLGFNSMIKTLSGKIRWKGRLIKYF